jgi:putative transposase
MAKPFPIADAGSAHEVRGSVTRRLLTLQERGELATWQVEFAASFIGRDKRTVFRWLEQARLDGQYERKTHTRFQITDDLRGELASVGGNASGLHRELVKRAAAGGPPAPSLATLHRALRRDLTRGQRAGLVGGEKARRAFDVYMRRPKGPDHPKVHRNLVWEADHVEASVWVDVNGRLRKPWITWFVDCATDGVCGLAVTAGKPNSASIQVALAAAIRRDDPYGPFGGIPLAVRIDRGQDFLSDTVQQVLGRFAIPVGDLPGYCPYLKGTVENLNSCVKKMLFATMPHYSETPTRLNGKPYADAGPAVTFEAFVADLLAWVQEWNTILVKDVLGGRTPEQAWLADAWPVDDIPAADLRLLTMADDGKDRTITGSGVSWKNRLYYAPWMNGRKGDKVRLRYMLHHDHEIEVFDAVSGAYLGPAGLQGMASPETIAETHAVRAAARRQMERDLKAGAGKRIDRFAPVTSPEPAQLLGVLTEAEAAAELSVMGVHRPQPRFASTLIPLPEPGPGWVVPEESAS